MKLMFIGATATHYIRDNWVKPLEKLYDVIFVNPFWLNKILGKEQIEEYIKQIIHENDIKYIFVYSDGIERRLSDDFYTDLKKDHFVFTFYPDDEPEKWYSFHEPYDHRFNLIFTQSLRGHIRREEKNVKNSVYMPWGYNPLMYYRVDNVLKDIDILYIGTNKINDDGNYFEEGKERRNLLCDVYQFCKDNEYKFMIYGAGWDKDEVLKECYGGYVSDDDIAGLISSSKIVLNFGISYEGGIDGYQTKLRHFEIGGCGTFQITNENPELRDLFGDNLGYFSTKQELYKCIKQSLDNMEETQRKADITYDESIKKHTMECRIKSMIKIADEKCGNDTPIDIAKESNVQIIKYNHEVGLESIKTQIKNGQLKITGKYCLFIDDISDDIYFNENIISRYLDTDKSIVGFNTVIRYFENSDKGRFLARRISDAPISQTILAKNRKDHTVNYDLIKDKYEGLENDNVWSPLMNHVIKTDYLEEFFSEYESGGEVFKLAEDTGLYAMRIDEFTDEMPKDEFDYKLEEIFSMADEGKTIALYGIGGFMLGRIVKAATARGTMDNLYFIDRDIAEDLNGKKLPLGEIDNGMEIYVHSYDDLVEKRINPEIIVIVSMFCGAEIEKSINLLEDKYQIVHFMNYERKIR